MDKIDCELFSNYYFLNSRSEKMDKWMTKQPNSQFSHSLELLELHAAIVQPHSTSFDP